MFIVQVIYLKTKRTENLKIRTNFQDKVIDSAADCSKNLFVKSRSSSTQYRSLFGFQALLFICDCFGCKLWLLSIMIYVKDFSELLCTTIGSDCVVQYE